MGSRALVLLAPAFLSDCSLLNHLSKSGYHQAVRQKGNKLRVGVRDYSVHFNTEAGSFREDSPGTFDNRGAIIAAIPSYEEPYIKVPKVLKQELTIRISRSRAYHLTSLLV
ncbi:hypothetical protein Tco_1103354 [Tanacetum coccineum]